LQKRGEERFGFFYHPGPSEHAHYNSAIKLQYISEEEKAENNKLNCLQRCLKIHGKKKKEGKKTVFVQPVPRERSRKNLGWIATTMSPGKKHIKNSGFLKSAENRSAKKDVRKRKTDLWLANKLGRAAAKR